MSPGPRPVHPIEVESYRIMGERVDLSGWPDGAREVVARVIHSTTDLDFAGSMCIGDRAVAAALTALRQGAPVVCDAHMLRAGLTGLARRGIAAWCLLDEVPTAPAGSTRSAAAIRLAAERHPDGALWVVGNAPTALEELLDLYELDKVRPAAVVGLPVGFVGAAESKARLWAGALRPVAITNVGEKGGTPAAAGAVNALARLAEGDPA
jgi:precorrin-8X/cobalt-precorrin-8 methylmutase